MSKDYYACTLVVVLNESGQTSCCSLRESRGSLDSKQKEEETDLDGLLYTRRLYWLDGLCTAYLSHPATARVQSRAELLRSAARR